MIVRLGPSSTVRSAFLPPAFDAPRPVAPTVIGAASTGVGLKPDRRRTRVGADARVAGNPPERVSPEAGFREAGSREPGSRGIGIPVIRSRPARRRMMAFRFPRELVDTAR